MNGTSKINSATSVSNTRTLVRRLPPNLKTKSKCAIKQHPINERVIWVITLTGMPPHKIFAGGTQSSRQVEITWQTLCSRRQIKFARDNKVWEIPHKNEKTVHRFSFFSKKIYFPIWKIIQLFRKYNQVTLQSGLFYSSKLRSPTKKMEKFSWTDFKGRKGEEIFFLPPQGLGPVAKTRGGTLGFPACIHIRNFKNVKM